MLMSKQVVTPVMIHRLLPFLASYDTQLTQYLYDGFTQGFKTGFQGDNTLMIAPEHPSVNQYAKELSLLIEQGIKSGETVGPFDTPPHPFFRSSPISIIPKRTPGKFRRIHNLSWPYDMCSVNGSIPDDIKSVQYATIRDAIHTIQKLGNNIYMCKLDIRNAYRIIPVHFSQHYLLGFSFKNQYYYERVLPQGMGTSCAIFECFSTALDWIINNVFKIPCHHILDDFILFGKTESLCKKALDLVLLFFDYVGIPVEPSKTEGPTTCLCFVGIQLDTVKMQSSLPLEKVTECVEMIDMFLHRKKVTLKEIQSLCGKLCFATCTIQFGRPFIRRLYDLTVGLKKPFYWKRLNMETKRDLLVWKDFLRHFNGKSFLGKLPECQTDLCSDASLLVGFGATYGKKWIGGIWPSAWMHDFTVYNIDVKEFYAVLACIGTFCSFLQNKTVHFYTDNLPVVCIVNKLTSKSCHVMPLVRCLALVCLQSNINLVAHHIPGHTNLLCDKISRNLHTTSFLQRCGMELEPTPVPMSLQPESFVLPLHR